MANSDDVVRVVPSTNVGASCDAVSAAIVELTGAAIGATIVVVVVVVGVGFGVSFGVATVVAATTAISPNGAHESPTLTVVVVIVVVVVVGADAIGSTSPRSARRAAAISCSRRSRSTRAASCSAAT